MNDPFPTLEENLYISLRDWLIYYKPVLKHTGRYRGLRMLQMPFDLESLRRILEKTEPEAIVEIGVLEGGRTLWLADSLQNLKLDTRVIGVDRCPVSWEDERIDWVWGDATTPGTRERVAQVVKARRTIVIDDANHQYATCKRLLEMYTGLVSPGHYYVLEDTYTSLLKTYPYPSGYEAAHEFVAGKPEWIIDRSVESAILTLNPCGYLLRQA